MEWEVLVVKPLLINLLSEKQSKSLINKGFLVKINIF